MTPPGSDRSLPVVNVTGGIVPGKIAAINTDNAAFFSKKPKGNANPDKLLRYGTRVKVVSVEGSYLKVELDDGAVGYVPAMMVEDPNAQPSPNAVQVYPPPQGGAVPIVPLTPGTPGAPGTTPGTTPVPGPTDVPEVIDPDAPASTPTPAPPPVPGDLSTPAPPIQKDDPANSGQS